MNPTKVEIGLNLGLTGREVSGSGVRWHIAGADEYAHNTPGKPRVVDIQQTNDVVISALRVPALSATLFVLPLK